MGAQNKLDSCYTKTSKHPPNLVPNIEELNLGIATVNDLILQLNDQDEIDIKYAEYSLKREKKRRATMMQ